MERIMESAEVSPINLIYCPKPYNNITEAITSPYVKNSIPKSFASFVKKDIDKDVSEMIISHPKILVDPVIDDEQYHIAYQELNLVDKIKLPFPKMTLLVGERIQADNFIADDFINEALNHRMSWSPVLQDGTVNIIKPYFLSEYSEGIKVTQVVQHDPTKKLVPLSIHIKQEKDGLGVFSPFPIEDGLIRSTLATVAYTIYKMTLEESDYYMSRPTLEEAKINKKRITKGKKPLIEFKIAKIKGRKTNVDPDAPKGTHASPRQHWRRGHWRTLSKTGRKVWVSASQVGDEANGKIIKAYAVGEVE
jgi:hypothetical protein